MRKRKKITVLVTGAEGMVGSYVSVVFGSDSYNNILASKTVLDVTDRARVQRYIRKYKPNVVLHLAAKTDVDACERDPVITSRVNYEGTKNIADICKKLGCILIYISTSAVFKGDKKGFLEHDIPDPVNVYGKSKLEGEKYILDHLANFYIVRAGWMIGGGKKEKKFVSYIINQAKNDTPLHVVNDKFGTVTYARELIEFLKILIEKKYPYGIYHFGSKGICSRFEMAKTILKTIKKKIPVNAVSSSMFMSTFSAPRPNFEVIKSSKYKFTKTWRQSIKDYITNEII